MFNTVAYTCSCPVCSAHVGDFQTKDGELLLLMLTVAPRSVSNFYAPCNACGTWIEFMRDADGDFIRMVSDKYGRVIEKFTRKMDVV